MADLYANFTYCQLAVDVDSITTTFAVDDTTRIPANPSLATADLFMTVENLPGGALGPTSTFEIVKVIAKSTNTGPGDLTVIRGQENTVPAAHQRTTYLKATVTAGMLERLVTPDISFTFIQATPASSWIIDHTLSFEPSVTVVDSAGTVVEGTVDYVSQSQVIISFTGSFSGSAYLS